MQKKFNKTYNEHHDPFKKEAWLANLEKIQRHNEEAAKGLHSYVLRDNNLADLVSLLINFILFFPVQPSASVVFDTEIKLKVFLTMF